MSISRSFLLFVALITASSQALASGENIEVLQNRLAHPWSMAFLPQGQGILITLRGGQLYRWQKGSGLSAPIIGVPRVWAHGQGGLLDVVLAPDFAQNRRVWLSYAEAGRDSNAGTAVGYGRLSEDMKRLENFSTVFRQQPKLSVGNHFGGRLLFDKKGYLYIALGENNQRATAQDLNKL